MESSQFTLTIVIDSCVPSTNLYNYSHFLQFNLSFYDVKISKQCHSYVDIAIVSKFHFEEHYF